MTVRPLAALALAAFTTTALGLAFAQSPAPAAPAPAALSDALPVPPAPAPKVSKAWVLMDFATGQVLAGENYDERVEPASGVTRPRRQVTGSRAGPLAPGRGRGRRAG